MQLQSKRKVTTQFNISLSTGFWKKSFFSDHTFKLNLKKKKKRKTVKIEGWKYLVKNLLAFKSRFLVCFKNKKFRKKKIKYLQKIKMIVY